MYLYIYDHFLQDKKYTNLLNRIETRLTDLGISGRTEKLTILKSLPEIIKEAKKREVDTIVIVGNDSTVSKVIGYFSDPEVTVGIIPIGTENEISRALGIPEGEAACDVLSSRIIEKLDLGKANNFYFISSLILAANPNVTFDIDNYHISSMTDQGEIRLCNFSSNPASQNSATVVRSSPQDGIMEAVFSSPVGSKSFFGIFKKQYSTSSVFPFRELKIKCSHECLPATADGHVTLKTPINVSVAPKKLKVIVGKNRMF